MSSDHTMNRQPSVFTGNFTLQEPLPDAAITAVTEVMRSGRLHRYNHAPDELSVVSTLEASYAQWQQRDYCLACASGGYAMSTALRALGVAPGNKVLTNAFTLAPVPGAIEAVSADAVLVEVTEDLVIDLADLTAKAALHPGCVLLLSHMRGHLANMHEVMSIAKSHKLRVVEDCAHTMGATFDGTLSGNFGHIACFSTQTYKHINSGEGGFLTTNDAELAARAIVLSGSYMLYERHGAAPPTEVFESIRLETPNCSGRMDNVRAAMLLAQMENLDRNLLRWNERYDAMHESISASNRLALPTPVNGSVRIGSSLQFRAPWLDANGCRDFMNRCAKLGVELKWFGDPTPVAFTSQHSSWHYVQEQALPETDRILSTLFDVRIPLTFSVDDCKHVGDIIASVAANFDGG